MESQIAKFLFELGQLKRVQRSGWWLAGVRSAESVAEHTFRAAAIAHVLAIMEGADAERAAALALFHDSAETRTNDLHRLGKRYVDWKAAEGRAVADQIGSLPSAIGERLSRLHDEYASQETPESRVAHDADRLECLLQGREYQEQGFTSVEEWIESSQADLKTDSAKRLAAECLRQSPGSWRAEGE